MRAAALRPRPLVAGAVLGPLVVACLPGLAVAQVRLTIEVEATAEAAVPVEAVAARPGGAVGDPWWDFVTEPAPPAAAPPPALDRARVRRQAEDRLAEVRRSRGAQILNRELSLVRAVCPGLDPAARSVVLKAGREAVAEQAAGRMPLVEGVETAIEEALRRGVGAASAAAYHAERQARAGRRRAAAIAVLVDAIDQEALLDPSGRVALAEGLAAAWRPEWAIAASLPLRQRTGDIQLPDGVAEVATAVLDEDTVAAWRRRSEEAGR